MVAGIGLNLTVVVLFLLIKGFLPPIIPLLYGRPSGAGQLLPDWGILLAPALSTLLIIINVVTSNYVLAVFSKKLLIAAGCLVSLLTTITVLKIIFLVGFF